MAVYHCRFFTFCGLSGSVYLLNDLADLERPLHSGKMPTADSSGELSLGEAKGLIILIISLLGLAAFAAVFSLALAYFMLNLAYSFKLKTCHTRCHVHRNRLCMRATAGVGAEDLEPEIIHFNWLLLSTLMLAMFLGLAKRRQEIANHSDDAVKHRKILAQYSLNYIDQMTSILAATAIVTYTFYTVSPETIAKFGSDKMIYTVPMVIYGILRYLYLIHIQDLGENPSEVVLSDRPLQACVVIWAAVVVMVIHFL